MSGSTDHGADEPSLYQVFADACAREGGARERYLAEVASSHPDLAAQLRELLASDGRTGAVPADPTIAKPPAWGSPGGASPTRVDAEQLASDLNELRARQGEAERYDVGDELGRGAMGSVRRVRDRSLRRELAMKTIREGEGGADAAGALARFLLEARILGRLDHPDIVAIHELGVDSRGRPYFTMPVLEGGDLSEAFGKARRGEDGWSVARAVGVLQRVCEAMAFAHSAGVVHRDLKPSNVMVGRFGEVQVMDWGVARLRGEADPRDLRPGPPRTGEPGEARASASPVRTMDGAIVGTPYFMPPEQARGRTDEVDERSDVYAVGAMLYELLSGRRPYEEAAGSNAPYAVLARLLESDPAPLANLAPDAPAELVAISEKAMARERSERYASMQELADDLRAFLEVRVVRAHATGALAELRKWVGRNRGTAASLMAVVFVALLALGLVIATQARASENVRIARDEAVTKAETATAINEVLAGLFRSPTFEQYGRDVRVVDVLERAVENLDAQSFEEPEVEIFLRRTIADTLFGISQYELAQTQHERVVAVLEGLPAPDLIDLGKALLGLASTRWKLNDVEGAASALQRGVGLVPADEEHQELRLHLVNLLAILLKEMGRFDEAEPLYVETMEAFERLVGAEAEETLTATNNYAYFLGLRGRDEEALLLHRRTLEGRRKLHGEGHPNTLNSMDNLAICLTNLERYDEAIEVARAAYDLRREVLGEHADTDTSANNLGRLLMNAGHMDEAEEYLRLAWENLARRFGPNHGEALICLQNLAELTERVDRLELAEEYRKAIVEGRRLDGHRPHELRHALDELGGLYGRLERHADRIVAYRELADVAGEMGDPRTRARALHEVGLGHLELDQVEESSAALENALGVWDDAALEGDRLLLSILEDLALVLESHTDRHEDAQRYGERARELEERLPRATEPVR